MTSSNSRYRKIIGEQTRRATKRFSRRIEGKHFTYNLQPLVKYHALLFTLHVLRPRFLSKCSQSTHLDELGRCVASGHIRYLR